MYSGRLQLLKRNWSHFFLNNVFLSSSVRLQPDSKFLNFIRNSGYLLAFVRMSEKVLFLFMASIIIRFGGPYSIIDVEGVMLGIGGIGVVTGAAGTFSWTFYFCRPDSF